MSNEKTPGTCLVYIGGFTTQVYRDYSEPLEGSLLNNEVSTLPETNNSHLKIDLLPQKGNYSIPITIIRFQVQTVGFREWNE